VRLVSVAACNRACQRPALPFEIGDYDCEGAMSLRYTNYDREGRCLTGPENLRRGDDAICNRACQRPALPFELRDYDCEGAMYLRYMNYDGRAGVSPAPRCEPRQRRSTQQGVCTHSDNPRIYKTLPALASTPLYAYRPNEKSYVTPWLPLRISTSENRWFDLVES
jgi:hypothetical protein